MSRRLFGTDGVRGVANRDLTPELALALGWAAGRMMREQEWPARAVIGRDTRQSGAMLGAAFAAGLCSAGVETVALGVVPTGCISFAARTGDYGLGAVISASHNPAPDNGIKLLTHAGTKLPDALELRVEALLEEAGERPLGGGVGRLLSDRADVARYLAMLEEGVPEGLAGLRLAVDAGHGAAYELGPEILRRLGADLVEAGTAPDGVNINAEGGATKPATIQRLTLEAGARLGIAFDGDADRAVFSDEQGNLLNGDRTLAAWAAHHRDRLVPPVVVGTVMSNGGFGAYLESVGMRLERAQVGDKYVAQRLNELDAKVGGEQSGHLIFVDRGPTGDGLITMLELLRCLGEEPASRWTHAFANWPQVLLNLEVERREGWDAVPAVSEALAQASQRLGAAGRINVRPSGTQPVLRVMVEAAVQDLRDAVADELVAVLLAELGGRVAARVDLTHALGD